MNGFASPYEERMAEILDRNGIKYAYGVNFPVRNGKNSREVDFVLVRPIRLEGFPDTVKYIENKGKMNSRGRRQRKELREAGIKTQVITKFNLAFFKKYGFNWRYC